MRNQTFNKVDDTVRCSIMSYETELQTLRLQSLLKSERVKNAVFHKLTACSIESCHIPKKKFCHKVY